MMGSFGIPHISHSVKAIASPSCELMFTPRHCDIAAMEKKPLKPEQTAPAVCARLSRLREALGLRKGEIAARVGLSQSQWSNYEKGIRMPNLEDMIRLADEFGASLDYIYRGLVGGLPHDLAMSLANRDHDFEPDLPTTKKPPVTFGEARAKRA